MKRLTPRSEGILFICCFILVVSKVRIEAHPRASAVAQEEASRVAVDADDIGGVVTSTKGPEAGVWVIAETNDLPTKFRKIVVTDDAGRYLLPELPKATYNVWVRGYGLVDSKAVEATPGKTLALTAVIAPDAQAAAQYYPGNYWFSLAQVPPKNSFPIDVPVAATKSSSSGIIGARKQIKTQAEWIEHMKSGCSSCHQMGVKATREIDPLLGAFQSSKDAWERMIRSGQANMIDRMDAFGHDRGIAMFADWTDRIAAGEVPPAPTRPEGIERNVVITMWDFSVPISFVHNIISTNKINPTLNPYGRIYGGDWSQGALEIVDPAENTRSEVKLPLRDENDRKRLPTWSPPRIDLPSSTWGNKIIWDDPVNAHAPAMDSKGRVWVNVENRGPENPGFCKADSGNSFAKIYPIESSDGWGVDVYDPKTHKIELIDLCFRTQDLVMTGGRGKDEIIYFSISRGAGGIGWFNTRIWDETHSAEKAQGWCRPILDLNSNGKRGEFTDSHELVNPKLDRAGGAVVYGVAFDAVDGSAWYADTLPMPGRIVRISLGASPPATCKTEVYEPPYENPKAPSVTAYTPRGIDVDSKGLVWTALASSGHLASFDRSKCKGPLNGPTATGQHCPEGWTLYPVPGPKFKGETDAVTDWFYANWTDQFNTLGIGKDMQVLTGTGSDSLIVFDPKTKEWITMRVPYPMGFYTRNLDGRIDDPKAGWKGRGLWTANETRVIWHSEGGKGTLSQVAHFQVRADPLAN